MKFPLIFLLVMSSLSFWSCDKDDNDPLTYDYHSHIQQPSSADKQMGETLFIQVEFESHTGEDVEHINVRIFKADNSVEAYNKPADPHIGGVSVYEYQDQIALTTANGFSAGDWVIEARVWGHDEGQDEEMERVEFHIHP
jgi:hypothetical protein